MEPLPERGWTFESVIITNHVASCSVEAIKMLRQCVAETVAMGVRGEPLPNIVNPGAFDKKRPFATPMTEPRRRLNGKKDVFD